MALIELKGLEKTIKAFKRIEKNIPFVKQNTLNSMAFDTQKRARRDVQKKFTLRNKFTLSSIQVQKATFRNNVSEVGSIAQYMAFQELGGMVPIKKIPTRDVRVGGSNEKKVQPSKRLNRFGQFPKITSKAKAVRAIKIAIRKKSRQPLRIVMNNKDAIYQIKYKGGVGKLRMIYDLTRSEVLVRGIKWLEPASESSLKNGRRFFAKNLNRLLKK